jgi:hypothetical protein
VSGPLSRRAALALLLAPAMLGLAACGKKPGALRPPVGTDPTRFPRTYPNPRNEPETRTRPETP